MTTPLSAREILAARARGMRAAETEPRAKSARYDRASGRVLVDLSNGCAFAFPARRLQGLERASDADLARVEVLGAGAGLHWESLDADFSLAGLLMGAFGTRAWMREQARRGGAARSPAKAAAARVNGRKGGRPKRTAPAG
ncbi:MAG TPA: DUF2442 domain-containing protein [Caulobacteraceae bacterium]|nr:DUF2442 domain-containing protein [Caulobacteraceae bacterium]